MRASAGAKQPRGTTTFAKGVGISAANGDAVNAVVLRLMYEPDYLIRSTVYNNPEAVRERYNEVYHEELSAPDLVATLSRKWAAGYANQVARIITVPFITGANDALDRAFAYLQGEASVRLHDPSTRAHLKSGPWSDDDVIAEDGTVHTGTSADDVDQADPSVWENILDSLPAIVDVVTGIAGGNASTTTGNADDAAAKAEADRKKKQTITYIILGVVVVVVVGVFVYVLRKTGKA